MLTSSYVDVYVCSACGATFEFGFHSALHHIGPMPTERQVAAADLLDVPVRPAWCKACDAVCWVEDIAPLRILEDAYGMVRNARRVEYPFDTDGWDPVDAQRAIADYLRWRMDRRHAARALCCGGTDYQFMDVAQPLIKHAECEFGFVEARIYLGSSLRCTPGVHCRADIRLYSCEGDLAGLLTWYHQEQDVWDVEPAGYAPAAVDD